jgi:hypothetical protein
MEWKRKGIFCMTIDEDELEVVKTLADASHPIWKVIGGLLALLTVLWTQNNVM